MLRRRQQASLHASCRLGCTLGRFVCVLMAMVSQTYTSTQRGYQPDSNVPVVSTLPSPLVHQVEEPCVRLEAHSHQITVSLPEEFILSASAGPDWLFSPSYRLIESPHSGVKVSCCLMNSFLSRQELQQRLLLLCNAGATTLNGLRHTR